MLITQMKDAIGEYCRCRGCGNCEISEICMSIQGNFNDNAEATLKAYKILTQIDPKADVVNHPSHYETGKFECIDVMVETQGKEAVKAFCLCNAFKYLYRHNNKNGIEDIKKARWYLEKFLELEGDNNAGLEHDYQARQGDS